jgi:hypothetical protein
MGPNNLPRDNRPQHCHKMFAKHSVPVPGLVQLATFRDHRDLLDVLETSAVIMAGAFG